MNTGRKLVPAFSPAKKQPTNQITGRSAVKKTILQGEILGFP